MPTRPTAAVESFRAAERALATGDLAAALEHAEAAVKADPTFDEAAWLQASLLGRAGRVDEALAVCQEITDRSPDFVQAHLLQGILWDQSGDVEAAFRSYDEVLKRYDAWQGPPDPGPRDLLLRSVVTYLRFGELEGVKAINQFLERFPEHPKALYIKSCMQQKERGFLLRWFSEGAESEFVPSDLGPALNDIPDANDPAESAPIDSKAEKE